MGRSHSGHEGLYIGDIVDIDGTKVTIEIKNKEIPVILEPGDGIAFKYNGKIKGIYPYGTKEVDVDYTEVCEFGVIKDHIVKVPKDKNSRRECFYLKAGDLVLPISKNNKIGVLVRYMPSVGKNLVQLPCKLEFDKNTSFKDFGELVTAVGYANDRQYMFLANDLEETDDFIWLTKEEILTHIKEGNILDGRVLAIIFKHLL